MSFKYSVSNTQAYSSVPKLSWNNLIIVQSVIRLWNIDNYAIVFCKRYPMTPYVVLGCWLLTRQYCALLMLYVWFLCNLYFQSPPYEYWNKVCVVFDKGQYALYYNGALVTREPVNPMPLNSQTDATLGFVDGFSPVYGYVDDVSWPFVALEGG